MHNYNKLKKGDTTGNNKWLSFNMPDNKFSIVIPVYNNTTTIERCLNSIYNQTYKNFEVILVDDCSPDVEYSYLKRKYENLNIIRTEENRGPGVTRQTGLDNATGDWVMFIDQDDELFSTSSLRDMHDILVKSPDALMIQYEFKKFYNNEWVMIDISDIRPLHGILFNIEFIRENNIRFPDTLRTHEDTYFYLRCKYTLQYKYSSIQNALVVSPLVVYKYYEECDDSITVRMYGDYNFFEYTLLNQSELFISLFKLIDQMTDNDNHKQDLLIASLVHSAYMYYLVGNHIKDRLTKMRKKFRIFFCCIQIFDILEKRFNIDSIDKLHNLFDATFKTDSVGIIRVTKYYYEYREYMKDALIDLYSLYTDKVEYIDKTLLM